MFGLKIFLLAHFVEQPWVIPKTFTSVIRYCFCPSVIAVTQLSPQTFVNIYCLTSLPDQSGNRSIHTDQFAIPVLVIAGYALTAYKNPVSEIHLCVICTVHAKEIDDLQLQISKMTIVCINIQSHSTKNMLSSISNV